MEAKDEPLFTSQGTAARVRSAIPGSVVEVNADDDNLWISAVFEARDYGRAYSQIRSILAKDLALERLPEVHLAWAPNQRAWELGVIRDELINALSLCPCYAGDPSHGLTLSTSGFTLRIHVCTAGLFDLMTTSREDRRRVKEELFRTVASIKMKLPDGITNVSIQIGDPEVTWLTPPFESIEDDGDNGNPNWPSRTGNPSGTGRGNNPPRR